MDAMIRIFVGYDPREAVAYHVLCHSIIARSSEPVTIAPLALQNLKKVFVREKHPLQSTEFSFSRFLVPHLSSYDDWSLFCDCDMLMLDDVAKLWALRDERFAVQVVKHDHSPADDIKFLDAPQTKYEKKNWSSVILFNNSKCHALTPEYVNKATGLELHQFKWLCDDSLIGSIPSRWNHLVDYDPAVPSAAISFLHYTEGGPYFEKYRNCGYAEEWFAEHARMLHAG
jgi:lipopolysaccharide biosynthesis glycosyltransferase